MNMIRATREQQSSKGPSNALDHRDSEKRLRPFISEHSTPQVLSRALEAGNGTMKASAGAACNTHRASVAVADPDITAIAFAFNSRLAPRIQPFTIPQQVNTTLTKSLLDRATKRESLPAVASKGDRGETIIGLRRTASSVGSSTYFCHFFTRAPCRVPSHFIQRLSQSW